MKMIIGARTVSLDDLLVVVKTLSPSPAHHPPLLDTLCLLPFTHVTVDGSTKIRLACTSGLATDVYCFLEMQFQKDIL